MKASSLKYPILSILVVLASLSLALLPFHAFLTVWLSSLFGHYTLLRLWKEGLLLVSLVGVAYLLLTDHKIRSHTLTRRLVWLIIAYGTVTIIWGLVAYSRHAVTAKALGYGLIVNLRFPAFFLVTWAVALRTARLRAHWQRLVLVPALIVVVFGLLQALVLPHNFLSHFGYGPSTISPYETINNNARYIRVESTLRGANPLGAYLVVPISVLAVFITRHKQRSWYYWAFLVGAIATLFFSFSRSAWIGAFVSVAIIASLKLRGVRLRPKFLIGAGVGLVLLGGLLLSLRHTTRFDNILLHTQSHSTALMSSNQGHVGALEAGVHDLIREPLGRGPGTAGPASVYNGSHPIRIAENYFIQIGQETGWLGLVLFLLINGGVGYLLWVRRADPLALSLFASLIGLSLINMLSHAWTDDTLAYVWWGLAGIAMVADKPKDTV